LKQKIIFDLGNVLLTFKPEKFLLKYTDNQEAINFFLNKITRSQIWIEMDRGTRTVESARIHFSEKYADEKSIIDFFFDNWMDIFDTIQDNVKILEDLVKNGYDCYYLSNFIREAYEFVIKKFEFFTLFKGGIISALVKMIKPERQIYLTLLKKYQLDPTQCIFIDDIMGFLRPAKKMGFKTIHYTSNCDLRERLKQLDVIF
jgi:FMN phosphatase YigB (HAD superfamily)